MLGGPNLVSTLFDTLPIGALVILGTDSSEWTGNFGGVIDGVVFLTNAKLFSNVGNPVTCHHLSVVRIPIRQVTFVSF